MRWALAWLGESQVTGDFATVQGTFVRRTLAERPAVLPIDRQDRSLVCRTESVPGHRFEF